MQHRLQSTHGQSVVPGQRRPRRRRSTKRGRKEHGPLLLDILSLNTWVVWLLKTRGFAAHPSWIRFCCACAYPSASTKFPGGLPTYSTGTGTYVLSVLFSSQTLTPPSLLSYVYVERHENSEDDVEDCHVLTKYPQRIVRRYSRNGGTYVLLTAGGAVCRKSLLQLNVCMYISPPENIPCWQRFDGKMTKSHAVRPL